MLRRGRVAAVAAEAIDIAWLEGPCQGCVGCGGRCSVFAKAPGEIERLPIRGAGLQPGMAVDVLVPARRLHRSAALAYGLALVALVLGAIAGHGLGRALGQADAGALVGLLAGTFFAGRLTKRLAATPALGVRIRPSRPDSDP
jgi:positive regulator of sigma E activity